MYIKTNSCPVLKTILLVTLYLFLAGSPVVSAQETQDSSAVLRIANLVLNSGNFHLQDESGRILDTLAARSSRKTDLKLVSPYNDWRYWNGVLNLAMINLGKILNDRRYIDFAIQNVNFGFDINTYFKNHYHGENKWEFPFGQFFNMEELDDCGAMGASVTEVCELDPQERFRAYMNKTAEHIRYVQDRLKDGTLVRSFPVKWTLWADDLYMSVSFLGRYGKFTGDTTYFDDAATQVINFNKYLFDRCKGLMTHNWYLDTGKPGIAFWGRANGWAMMAQIDLLERLPENYPARDTLIALFTRHAAGIAGYQSESGLWHQLINKTDSYLETSCSAMFVYAITRAVNLGILNSRFAAVAAAGWQGIVSRIREDGQIEGVCTGTIVFDDLRSYYLRPAPLNDIHGVGAVILAGSEMISLRSK